MPGTVAEKLSVQNEHDGHKKSGVLGNQILRIENDLCLDHRNRALNHILHPIEATFKPLRGDHFTAIRLLLALLVHFISIKKPLTRARTAAACLTVADRSAAPLSLMHYQTFQSLADRDACSRLQRHLRL
jgi:hypothetical protein